MQYSLNILNGQNDKKTHADGRNENKNMKFQ